MAIVLDFLLSSFSSLGSQGFGSVGSAPGVWAVGAGSWLAGVASKVAGHCIRGTGAAGQSCTASALIWCCECYLGCCGLDNIMLFSGHIGLYGIFKQKRNWVLQPGIKQIASPALTQPVFSLFEAGISRNMARALSMQSQRLPTLVQGWYFCHLDSLPLTLLNPWKLIF